MTVARRFLVAHLLVLALLLGGILYALRHPELWADRALGRSAFDFGMEYGATLSAALGAATILAFGFATAGPVHTERVFIVAVVGSLLIELIGTSNLPVLGNYTYTDFLGGKVLDRVPYSVPLSAFAMGVSAYLLARAAVARRTSAHPTLTTAGLAAWLLTAWLLALAPSTSGSDLAIQFWEWQHKVPYVGLALQNCLLWAAATWVLVAAAHHVWGRDAEHHSVPVGIPFTLYAANVAFAIALSASIGLVLPILIGVLGLIPAALALGYGLGDQPGDAGRLHPLHAP